jgi:hypothetical protein
MAECNVTVKNEVSCNRPRDGFDGDPGWKLCFQECTYNYGDGIGPQYGYRFIWRRPDGKLQAGRAQARIPAMTDISELTKKAAEAGWLR